jgi:hypothetical protein
LSVIKVRSRSFTSWTTGSCPFDIALADMRVGQIPEDDCLGLVTTVEATGGALQDRACRRAVTEGEIAGALNPSEPVVGQQAMGGIGRPHRLEMGLGGAKGGLIFHPVAEHRVALADMQERETLQSVAPSRRGQCAADWPHSGEVERPGRVVRFAH